MKKEYLNIPCLVVGYTKKKLTVGGCYGHGKR